MSSPWQDRIVRLDRRPAGELAAHPQNWRRHPEAQRKTMQAAANEVGLVAPLVENLRSEERGWPAGSTPTLIDGHLRLELALERGESQLPVVVVDLTEREEALALASLDPIGAQAEADPELLAALLDVARPESPDLAALLEGLVGAKPEPPADPGPQVDRAAELQEKWKTERGQVWVIRPKMATCPHCNHEQKVGDEV